ncbi:MAG: DUF3047 domain-containing protein [Candidatus Omnitrophica bacterium]|nr:DUF3047 domain-containing protein [Candidatus Omnitrophota bacterium]
MRKVKIIYILIASLFAILVYSSYAGDLPKWFLFNKENSINEWQEKVFKGKVLYAVEARREGGYLTARSEEACSGLFYRISFDPAELPMISWQWKVKEFPKKVTEGPVFSDDKNGWIEKDDYAARVYVIFPSLNFRRTRCIEYIWDQDLKEGTIMTSPYFKNIKLIVVESGYRNIDTWVFEKRNIYQDYKDVFGKPPRSRVGAIALMTDTDNTLSTAEALYKDIKVGYKDEQGE